MNSILSWGLGEQNILIGLEITIIYCLLTCVQHPCSQQLPLQNLLLFIPDMSSNPPSSHTCPGCLKCPSCSSMFLVLLEQINRCSRFVSVLAVPRSERLVLLGSEERHAPIPVIGIANYGNVVLCFDLCSMCSCSSTSYTIVFWIPGQQNKCSCNYQLCISFMNTCQDSDH